MESIRKYWGQIARRLYSRFGASKQNTKWWIFKCLQNIDMDSTIMHSKFWVHMNIGPVFLRAKLEMHHSYIPVSIQYTVILNGIMMYFNEKLQGLWTSAKNPILAIIKRVFKKIGFEYVNILCLELSLTFKSQIIKLFFNLHSCFFITDYWSGF